MQVTKIVKYLKNISQYLWNQTNTVYTVMRNIKCINLHLDCQSVKWLTLIKGAMRGPTIEKTSAARPLYYNSNLLDRISFFSCVFEYFP